MAFLWAGHCKVPAWEVKPKGGGVLPANFFKVGFEFVALCGGDGARRHMTGLIVAVNKAFFADVKRTHMLVFSPTWDDPLCIFL